MDGTQNDIEHVPTTDLGSLRTDRFVWVTGKGGTGKSTVAAALARTLAAQGRRTLLCEIDAQNPVLTEIFGRTPSFAPAEVLTNLSIANITWKEALVAYLRTMLPISRLVRTVLANEVVSRFIEFTPGSREIVMLTVLAELRDRYDVVVVDMPASGHAFGFFDITRSALNLFRGGPVRRKVLALRELLVHSSTRGVFVALPEDMVINETIETYARFRDGGLLGGRPAIILNRAFPSSLSTPERILLDRLRALELSGDAAALVNAGSWRLEREEATDHAVERLARIVERKPVLLPMLSDSASAAATSHAIALELGAHLGLTAEALSWT